MAASPSDTGICCESVTPVPQDPRPLSRCPRVHRVPQTIEYAKASRDLIDVLDAEPFLPADVIQLTDWVSDYYLAGPGATLAVAMPSAMSP